MYITAICVLVYLFSIIYNLSSIFVIIITTTIYHCAEQSYVNLTQARTIWEEGTPVEKMHPPD